MKTFTNFTKVVVLVAMSILLSNCSKDAEINDTNNTDVILDGLAYSLVTKNIPGRYIVVLKKDAGLSGKFDLIRGKAKGLLKRYDVTDAVLGHVYSYALQGFSIGLSQQQMIDLSNDEAVLYIEQDQTVTMNQEFSKAAKGGKKPPKGGDPAQSTPWGITRVGGQQNGSGKTAWIIDSGIDLQHPDLNVDVGRSRSFLSGRQGSNPGDQNGHGTHVAGTVAAIDNSIGVVGVAAGASVVSVRVLDRRGSGSISGVVAGVDYVLANGSIGEVANMSLGGGISTTLDNAVIAASVNVKFVLAAGNSTDDVNNHSPARANGANIYTVSAMDSLNNWAYFSNYSSTIIEYCAPGVNIHSTWKGGGYNTISGTSMSAPHVCGLLLMGTISSNGVVNNDPALPADPIAYK